MELREENTVDVLIILPGNQAELVTLPIKGHPFDTFFQGQPYRTGQHDGYTFAFLIHGKQYGLTKNISIGSDLLFQDIYGPIVFAYPLACVTLEDALDIVRKYGLPKDVIDRRLFTHRIPLPGDGHNFDDLIYDIPWFRWIPSYEESQKYIVPGYDELSVAVFQLIMSDRRGFALRFAHSAGWHPVVQGFSSPEALIQFTEFAICEYETNLEPWFNDVRTGKWAKDEARRTLSELTAVIKAMKASVEALGPNPLY